MCRSFAGGRSEGSPTERRGEDTDAKKRTESWNREECQSRREARQTSYRAAHGDIGADRICFSVKLDHFSRGDFRLVVPDGYRDTLLWHAVVAQRLYGGARLLLIVEDGKHDLGFIWCDATERLFHAVFLLPSSKLQ
jgi:hypothetical protein